MGRKEQPYPEALGCFQEAACHAVPSKTTGSHMSLKGSSGLGPNPGDQRATHTVVNFQSTESQLMAKGEADTKDESEETVPNPFSQLTDQELEEYKKEVERKKLELEGKEPWCFRISQGGGEGLGVGGVARGE